jgi:hypothetical protein
MHRIDPDVERRELQRRRFCHAPHRPFGPDIGDGVRNALQACRRRDVDDSAAAGSLHQWRGGLQAQHDTKLIDAKMNHQVGCGLRNRFRPVDPGIVDQAVEAADALAMSDDVLPVRFAGDIEPLEIRAGAEALGDLSSLFLKNVGDDDPSALADETTRLLRALAAGGAGDQDDLVGKTGHVAHSVSMLQPTSSLAPNSRPNSAASAAD